MSFPDCLGSPNIAIIICLLCLLVFVDYCRIARVWLKAAKKYQGARLKNPWLIQSIIFVSCGVCGYLTIVLSAFDMQLAIYLKLLALIALKVADEWFLSSVANKALVVAKEAELGRSLLFISSQVKLELIAKDDAIAMLQTELDALIDI